MKQLIFLKLGGSLITKQKPYSLDLPKIREIAKEIQKLKRKMKFNLLIGNGGGSFAHFSANRFQTVRGYINKKSLRGHVLVENDASKLNRIVVGELIDAGINAISVQTSAQIVALNGKIKYFYLKPIINYLKNDLVPVVFGDVVSDLEKGCTILSTEQIFTYLAKKLRPNKIILMGKEEGVYIFDFRKKIVSEINKENFKKIKPFLKSAEKIDVTGGMAHKVREAIKMSKYGAEVFIVGGRKGILEKCLKGEKVGTKISF